MQDKNNNNSYIYQRTSIGSVQFLCPSKYLVQLKMRDEFRGCDDDDDLIRDSKKYGDMQLEIILGLPTMRRCYGQEYIII